MDPALCDRLGATWQHPVDEIEPDERESERHEDQVRLLQVMAHAFQWVFDAKNARVGAWQAVYALGLPQAAAPMADIAASLGVERATISRGAVSLRKALNLPPSPAMRSEQACNVYSTRRKSQLKSNEHGNRNGSSRPPRG